MSNFENTKALCYNGVDIPCCEPYDVLVSGFGISGFAAACTAARNGLRTLIVERSSEAGGTATLAGVANFCSSGSALKGDSPLFDELIDLLTELKAIGEENGYAVKFNESIGTVDYSFAQEQLSPLLLHMAGQSGVDILLRTELVDAICDDGVVKYAIIHNESLLRAVPAAVFIDASGDGALSLHCGASALPVQSADGLEAMPPAFRIFLHKSSEPKRQELLASMSEQPLKYKAQFLSDGGVVLKINLVNHSTLDCFSRNDTELELRERIFATVRAFQDEYGCEYRYCGSAAALGVRESVRILGEHVLSGDELRAGSSFDDAIANGSFIIDTVYHHEPVLPYQIPYRSILVKGTVNLMVVGRCFSADRAAASSARVMMTACALGQASGAAAVISLNEKLLLRDVKSKAINELVHRSVTD